MPADSLRSLLSLYPVAHPPAPARSAARWVEHPEIQALRVAEINRIDGLNEVLARLPQFSCSDYHPGALPGAIVDGVRCEDLTRLTYLDASFDLVLTSETLEHVPDLVAALNEIRRILVPGGRHIFTIPLVPGVAQTFARSVVRPDGSIEDLATRICHPGGDIGYPSLPSLALIFLLCSNKPALSSMSSSDQIAPKTLLRYTCVEKLRTKNPGIVTRFWAHR